MFPMAHQAQLAVDPGTVGDAVAPGNRGLQGRDVTEPSPYPADGGERQGRIVDAADPSSDEDDLMAFRGELPRHVAARRTQCPR
jgi:hypothetical protein